MTKHISKIDGTDPTPRPSMRIFVAQLLRLSDGRLTLVQRTRVARVEAVARMIKVSANGRLRRAAGRR